jgi:pimeloyl-ACP methyl ester carboxylesterase
MKKTVITLFIFILLVFNNAIAQNTIDKHSITGSWIGKLNAGAITLRIVFNLSLIEKDSLVATLDSPDQGARNIKLGPVTFDGKSLRISAGALLAEYNGTFKNDTLIEGTWKQSGNVFDLNLIKLKKAFDIHRPQEPEPPFPYKSEEVVIPNTKFNIKLSGTLTEPEGKGPFPAVILITGSGAQNRNEELLGHKPFLVIADYLTRNGIAVLRYDDRGVGKSQGNYATATSADLATDAEAAFNFLRKEPGIDHDLIGLAGHSEGGLIAPIVASSDKGIAFIISLAGPGVNGEKLIDKQNMDISLASGADKKKIEEGISINNKLFAILKNEPDNAKAHEEINETYKKILEKENMSSEEVDQKLKQLNKNLNPLSYTWLRYFLFTDPAKFWKKVKCPVLALNGEKDLQVSADVNLNGIEKALRSGGNKSVTIVKLPGLNHLFQHCKTGLPSEYGEIEETISPEVLKIMADWIHGLQDRKPAF